MKIALCLRGIHYANDNIITDYRNSNKNYMEQLIEPLKKNNDVDIFLLTYESEIINELLNDYNPKDIIILNSNERFNGSNWHRQLIFHKSSIDLVKGYENNNNFRYDIIINVRFDLFFTLNFQEWNIVYNKINIMFKHPSGNCDDNFFIIPRNYFDLFYDATINLLINNKITHEYNHVLNEDNIHYAYNVSEEDCNKKIDFHYWNFLCIHK